jgi:uncharacterized membrane protein
MVLILIFLLAALVLLGLGFTAHVLWVIAVVALAVAAGLWTYDHLRARRGT